MIKKIISSSPVYEQEGLLAIRVILGFFMLYHGWEIFNQVKMNEYIQWDLFKKSPMGKWLVYAGKGAELIGGLLLMLGMFTRLAALIVMGTMSYICFVIGHGKIWYEDQHPFLFILLAAVFFFTGAGRYSIDQFILNNNKR